MCVFLKADRRELKENAPFCTSLDVAEKFGKEHKHVLRDIRELRCSEEFLVSNFGLSHYETAQGKSQPMYIMTRDGFTLLVMGYIGDVAMKFKEAYIKQFNAMEKALRGKLGLLYLHKLHLYCPVRKERKAVKGRIFGRRKRKLARFSFC